MTDQKIGDYCRCVGTEMAAADGCEDCGGTGTVCTPKQAILARIAAAQAEVDALCDDICREYKLPNGVTDDPHMRDGYKWPPKGVQ